MNYQSNSLFEHPKYPKIYCQKKVTKNGKISQITSIRENVLQPPHPQKFVVELKQNLCENRTSLAVGGRLNFTVASTSNKHSLPSLRVPQTNTVKNSGCSGDEEVTQMYWLLVRQYFNN